MNRKQAVAEFHKKRIIEASCRLFAQKGYAETTISDISAEAEYSRRTIYAYFESKEDILNHIVEEGLSALLKDVESAVSEEGGFIEKYKKICRALVRYKREHQYSAENIQKADTGKFADKVPDGAVGRILELGTRINGILEKFISDGQCGGIVRKDIIPGMSVYVIWTSIDALVNLCRTKGKFIQRQFGAPEEEFLEYGLKQIINSVLEVRI